MKYKFIQIIGFLSLFLSCDNSKQLTKIETQNISVNAELASNAAVDAYMEPYKTHVESAMNTVISYAPKTHSKKNGQYNTALGNMMADAVMELSNPVFKSRTGKNLDMVLLNHGGIRSILSKGDVTNKTAFGIMPFENSVVVTALKGSVVLELASYLKDFGKAHPISGLEIVLNADLTFQSILINGQEIEPSKTYYVATNDYLYKGGDRMDFFKKSDTLYDLNYKIRNVLIDYFTKYDTINPTKDQRFIPAHPGLLLLPKPNRQVPTSRTQKWLVYYVALSTK